MDLLKIVTDGCGHIMIVTGDDEELWRIDVREGTGIDENDITDELIDQVRNAWQAINAID